MHENTICIEYYIIKGGRVDYWSLTTSYLVTQNLKYGSLGSTLPMMELRGQLRSHKRYHVLQQPSLTEKMRWLLWVAIELKLVS